MGSNVYKSFSSNLISAGELDVKTGVVTPISIFQANNLIERDIRFITDLAEFHLRNDKNLRRDIENSNITQNNTLGRSLGVTIDSDFMSSFFTGKKGFSRYCFLLQDKVIREARSWLERTKATNGTSSKHVSSGWKRTANGMIPDEITP